MTDIKRLDQAFKAIMLGLVETGNAPHYAQIAHNLGWDVEEARQAVHDIFETAYPGWLHPGTDYIASFPPFSSLPTQWQITVDARQQWFAQCGFEALATCWVFPGRLVRIEAPCLDCGDPVVVEMRDGKLLRIDPPETIGHCNHPWKALADRSKRPFI